MALAEWEGLSDMDSMDLHIVLSSVFCLPEFRHPFHVDVDQAMAPNG